MGNNNTRRAKRYSKTEVDALTKNAVREALEHSAVTTNSNMNTGLRSQIASMMSGGYDWADTLHHIYLDYGYPAQLTFFNFWNMYRRFGIAQRVVEIYPDLGWMEPPALKTSNGDDLEIKDLDVINQRVNLWNRLKGLDTRQRVGRYAGMFMRVRDGKPLSEPLEGKLPGPGALINMVPLYESQLTVSTTNTDLQSDDYGMPTMYEFSASATGNRNDKGAKDSFNIHPSRIVIASEDADNGSIYGRSVLEPVYNSLMDLRKIIGAGGEGFYKNTAQSVLFELQDGASAKGNGEFLKEFNEQYDEFTRAPGRRGMWTPGLKPSILQASLANPKEHFTSALNDVSAGSKVPSTVLIGQQTGRLAGEQDSRGLLASVQSRRNNWQTEMVNDVVDWLMEWGLVERVEYKVDWPDALALSDGEKLDNAVKMSQINEKTLLSGQPIPFSTGAIQKTAGHEPEELPEDEPNEELPPDGEDM